MNGTATVVSKADYARHRGCTQPYISRIVKEGRLHGAVTPEGHIIRELADDLLGPRTQRVPPGGVAVDLDRTIQEPNARPATIATVDAEPTAYSEARARRETASATKAELELEELRGRLVDRTTIVAEIEGRVGRLRDRLLGLPYELSDRLAHITEPAKVRAELTQAIERALTESAQGEDDEDLDAAA